MDTVFTSRNKIRLILLALVMAILVGLGAIVLHDLFDFLWEDILHTVPALQRSGIVLVSGLLSALGWYFLQRQGRRLIPLKKQISPQSEIEEYPPFWRQLGHLFLQVITVGMGAPVGKEVAPRELGSLFSTHLVRKIPLDSDQRSVLVASSAAAGLAAIYQIPFASLIFVFEVLGIPLTAINVVVAFITTYGATAIAHLRISDAPLYHVNPQPVTWVTFVVTVILTFATIPVARLFSRISKHASQNRTKDSRILWQLPLVFVLLAVQSYRFPELLGNGAPLVQAGFDSLSLPDALVLFTCKYAIVLLCLRFGSYGGTMTPSISLGVAFGEVVCLVAALFGFNDPSQIYLAVAACSFLGITMNAPITAGMIVYSFIGFPKTYLFPVLLSIGLLLLIKCRRDASKDTESETFIPLPDGSQLHYQIVGEGETLVFLHGNNGNYHYFSKQIPYFSQKYQLVLFDSRGHGQSTNEKAVNSFDLMADDIAYALKELGIDKAIFIGYSDGANLALTIALKYSDLVTGLVLNAGNIRLYGEKWYAGLSTHVLYRVMKRLLPYFPQLENYMINMRLMMEDMPIHLNDLARVTVPSLVLIGGWDLISYEHSLEIANHLGNGHLVSVPFRLHNMAYLSPKRFNKEVNHFLTQLEENKNA